MFFKNTINILKQTLVSSSLLVSCQHGEKNRIKSYSDPLRTQYQNYLKTDSYSVLSKEDFKNYPIETHAIEFEKLNRELPVWVCTISKRISFVCDDKGYSALSSTAEDNFNSSFSFEQDGIFYEFITRRGFPIESCHEQTKIWKKLVSDQKFVCAAGEPLTEIISSDDKLRRTLVYHLIKSKNRCTSWFEGNCSITKD